MQEVVASRQQVQAGGLQELRGLQIALFFLFPSSDPARTFAVNSFYLKYIV